MGRQIQDENDATSAFTVLSRHCPHARIVRIDPFEATRSEVSGPVPITWVHWRLQTMLRTQVGQIRRAV